MTTWFIPSITWEASPTGNGRHQPYYSDFATPTCLTVMVTFGMAVRQTEGFDLSTMNLISRDWAVRDYISLSRCQTLKVNIPSRSSDCPLDLLADSTGVNAEG
jgi:hypothetical protein